MARRWDTEAGTARPSRAAPRRVAALLLTAFALVLPATPAAAYTDPLWKPDYKAAKAYAKSHRGDSKIIAFSLRTHMHLWNWRASETEPSASAVKVMIMTAYLRRGSVKNSDLSGDQRYNLEQMIEWSDDHATDRIFAHVHCSGLNSLAHTVGMKRFTACGDPNHPHWGRSRIDAEDQSLFLLNLEKYLPSKHRSYALSLMRHIHRGNWGIGEVHPPGWQVMFKSGWGLGTGWVDNQVALLRYRGMRIGVAVLSYHNRPDYNSGGSHPYGKRLLKGLFSRLLKGLGKNSLVE